MSKRTIHLIYLVFVLGLILAGLAKAAPVGMSFAYQGHLIDNNSQADGLYDFQFKLYDDAASGAKKGNTIEVNDLDVIEGYFTVQLDFGSDPNIFNGQARWLEIAVRSGNSTGGFSILTPRQAITPSPYALFAMNGGSGAGSGWVISDSNMYSGVTGNVGIGTTSPGAKLDVNGRVQAKRLRSYGSAGNDLIAIQPADDSNPTWSAVTLGNSTWTAWPFMVLKNGNILSSGKLGIGTTNPSWPLEVSTGNEAIGIMHSASGAARVFSKIGSNGSGAFFVRNGTGGEAIYLSSEGNSFLNGGNVGIGTTSPTNKLEVQGGTAFIPGGINSGTTIMNWPGYGTGLKQVSGAYIYPGRTDSGDWQNSWYLASNGSYGLYTNTGLYTAGSITNAGSLFVSGNVGIGTSSPTAKLDVVGSIIATSPGAGAAISGIHTDGTGVYGQSGVALGWAGYFQGRVRVTGQLTKGSGSFQIDHPLDPENKFLQHSFVESPDMMNIYNGNITLDEKGEAVITLPEWFGKLNKDFRYQLTAIGAPGPNLYISEEITDNQFKIAGGKSGMKVSWQVTGVRQDPYAVANRIVVEEDKPEYAKGYYLHPESYGLPKDRSIENAPKPKPSEEHQAVAKEVQQ